MNHQSLVEVFGEFIHLKNIDRIRLMKVIEDMFRTLLRRKYGSDENFDIIVNAEKGDLEIWRRRLIVEDDQVTDVNTQIGLTEARAIEPDFQLGEEVMEQIDIIKEFGRRAILTAKQTLASRVAELERDEVIRKYKEKEGEIVTGEVYQIWRKEILLLDEEGNELIMPKSEQIPNEQFRKGDTVRAVVKSVELNGSMPLIIVSRTDPRFLAKLLEKEVPEIYDGLITIRRIVREPGERAKVAVESYDDRIDPVGACVGMRGSRIHGIVKELRNENIDVINFTTNTQLFITRALAPAKISSMEIDDVNKRAIVYLKPDQISLAIGRGGVNIRLASKLTGYTLDVFRESEETEAEYDIDLSEFSDEIEPWIIEQLRKIGCDTARSVLALSRDEIARRADLEEETVDEVMRILRAEFESDGQKQKADQPSSPAQSAPQEADAGSKTEENP
ncbi:MAG: transcription termination factor NusA [Chitinophagales bacterium]|nr:transcription termination factor NusA [Chitinophagales bacterium]MDW8427791.1 transcription termination factor NusA [Chitinophagales bacterium]